VYTKTIYYKPLNKEMTSDNYTLPNIANIYKKLAQAKILSEN
jgi:hypothetical protein